ncbi:ATP-binding cassette domain-containing protein [Enterococcus alishanensis]|uniref:ATP-binding cassette domain-containing protein n=1 Tax=Enterococcus alishanensis TaxID=1303817 RepID=A0ABS6T8N1_9ENTE|nr:ATP-binding cassette domain-containing protein [Enterococcus alishanensis]MBV7389251.1 ATP-binding cassette domain-containing protein [Enterococcus alishanensis]
MKQLVLENVSYCPKNSTEKILDQINGEFLTGKIYFILGKKQTGKTTLLSILAGLVRCTEGKILVDGEDLSLTNQDDFRAEKICCLFQNGNLVNDSALANLELEMLLSKQPNRTDELINSLQIAGLTDKKIKTNIKKLTKKERQMVYLAKILVSRAKLILLDDPSQLFSELDEEMIVRKIADFCRRNDKCLVIVSQSNNAIKFADELWGLNGGKLLFIKEQPR